MSPHSTTPDRLIAALIAAGWQEVGGREGKYVRLRFKAHDLLLVPLDPSCGDYEQMISDALAELQYLADIGLAADRALTEATCSCGGRRWVDDEGWQPEEWAMAVKPAREPGAGLIPCGNCNHGGWNVPPGASADG